jgi:protocatechuate 3,4-dioxygenase beta subunit
VTVTLKQGSTVVATTTTSASGVYSFTNVMPGAYTIIESDLSGYTSTLPVNNTLAVTLVSGTASTGNNFYDTLPGTVRGSVLVDLNGDGVADALDTNAISGVTVTLKQGSNVVATTTTDAQGGYSFTNVIPGSYTVVETDLAGYTSTLPADNTDAITVTAGGTATALFYDTQKTAISGNVRLDVNGNGIVDTADTNGIAAVTVTLKQGSTVVATTTTSASGVYSFTNVMPGAYTIIESDLSGYTSTLPVNNTLAVTLVSGTASTGNNFYDTLPGTVRGSVLVDLNGDGVADAVDTNAISGVTVTLKQGSTVIGTTTTDAQGGYTFTNVMPGSLHGGGDRSGGLYQHAAGG